MICKICNADKSDNDFYVSNKSCCKDCVRARARKRREENLEDIRAYDRNRPNKTERKQKMKEYKKIHKSLTESFMGFVSVIEQIIGIKLWQNQS